MRFLRFLLFGLVVFATGRALRAVGADWAVYPAGAVLMSVFFVVPSIRDGRDPPIVGVAIAVVLPLAVIVDALGAPLWVSLGILGACVVAYDVYDVHIAPDRGTVNSPAAQPGRPGAGGV